MNSANNTNAQTRNATHSVAITALAGEFIVSCFPIGADGEPDTDREIVFKSFTDGSTARRVYADLSGLLACNAAKMDDTIDWVYRCASSLGSCLHREVPNESRRLATAVAELEIATLARRNPARQDRKVSALAHAANVLANRNRNLPEAIAKETACRELAGQP